jgi:hypothetical protein
VATLTATKEAFAEKVAKATGLQIPTVRAWVLAEGGPDDNPLNIMAWTSAGARYVQHFGTPDAAATATVSLLRKPAYVGVTSAAVRYTSPVDELKAIAASPWEENHYRGNSATPGALLLSAYRSVTGSSSVQEVDAKIPLPGFLPDVTIPLPGFLPDVTIPGVPNLPGVGNSGGVAGWLLDLLGVGNLTTWLEGESAKAFAYLALTALALALGGLGVLRILGASPGGLVRSFAPAKARTSGAQTDEIPF